MDAAAGACSSMLDATEAGSDSVDAASTAGPDCELLPASAKGCHPVAAAAVNSGGGDDDDEDDRWVDSERDSDERASSGGAAFVESC